jgi:hypothetical protein
MLGARAQSWSVSVCNGEGCSRVSSPLTLVGKLHHRHDEGRHRGGTPSRFLCHPTLGSQFSIPLTHHSRWPRNENHCFREGGRFPIGDGCAEGEEKGY